MQPMSQQTEQPPSDSAVLAQRIREKYRTFRTGIHVLGWVLVAYFGFHALQAMADQNTSISVALSLVFAAAAELKVVLLFSFAGVSIVWAIAERQLRYRKVEFLQKRIKALEISIDPRRTSSQLTIEGKTNPEDRG
jgi:hypothetical protein